MDWAEFRERQITIRCVGFDDAEVRTLHENLKTLSEVEQVRVPLNESIHDVERDILYIVISAGALAGKKLFEKGVDILGDRIKEWLANRNIQEGVEVEIFGPDDKVIKKVRRK